METPVRLRAGQRVRVVRGLLTGPGTIAEDKGAPYAGANGVRCWPVQFDGTPGDLPVLVAESDLASDLSGSGSEREIDWERG